MNLLLVEDDKFKSNIIQSAISTSIPDSEVTLCSDVQAAVANIQKNTYDFVLLDMALPSHQLLRGQGPPASLPSGGIEIILELSFLNRRDPIIVITQYYDIDIEGEPIEVGKAKQKIQSEYGANVAACILFNPDDDAWSKLLISTILTKQ